MTDSPKFTFSMLQPKYWGVWLVVSLLWVIRFLPRRWIMSMGGWLGYQICKRNHKRVTIASINLALCFPELTEDARQQILQQHYRVFGATLLDFGTLFWASPKRLAQLIDCPEEQRYQEIIQGNSIFFTPHIAALDAGGTVISRNGKGISMMKRDRNALLTWLFYRSRSRFNDAIILMRDQGLKPMLRGIKSGRACYYMPDEDFGDAKFTEFAPFFGVQTSTITMLGRLAKLGNAVCCPCITILDLDTGNYRFEFGEPLKNYPSNDTLADVTAMNAGMEQMIRKAPEQFIWTFKWFRTRPEGEKSPYPD